MSVELIVIFVLSVLCGALCSVLIYAFRKIDKLSHALIYAVRKIDKLLLELKTMCIPHRILNTHCTMCGLFVEDCE